MPGLQRCRSHSTTTVHLPNHNRTIQIDRQLLWLQRQRELQGQQEPSILSLIVCHLLNTTIGESYYGAVIVYQDSTNGGGSVPISDRTISMSN
jgi:hypothetical protein